VADALIPWSKQEGVEVGVSCYSPEQLSAVFAENSVALAQLPGNALDQRLSAAPLRGCEEIEIHLRSAFLQGLLLMPQDEAAKRIPEAAEPLRRWHLFCEKLGLSPLQTALGVVKSFSRVASIVVGVDSLRHWREIAHAWTVVPAFSAPELACEQLSVIDPRLWRT
jgi:hypothetical protein